MESVHLPRHVAIIMDGNGRWAQQRGLPRLQGHWAGADNVDPVVKVFIQHGIEYLTLYVFSTENWTRPQLEVAGLIRLLADRIDAETDFLHKANVRLRHLGRPDRLPPELRQKIEAAVELTRNNTAMTLCGAFDYGGRAEILQATQRLINDGISHNIDEALFSKYLYTDGIPDPDLIIRTGGEMRLSNFLLWQAAYSELYFTPVLWPDFGERQIEEALLDYRQRQRRFGNL